MPLISLEPVYYLDLPYDQQSDATYGQRIRVAEFADGYSQRARVGTNSSIEVWQVTWIPLPEVIAESLIQILQDGMVLGVYWQNPNDLSADRWQKYRVISEPRRKNLGEWVVVQAGLRQIPNRS